MLKSASDDGRSYVVEKRVMVSSEMLDGASAALIKIIVPVNFALNTVGARKFGKVTGDNIGQPFDYSVEIYFCAGHPSQIRQWANPWRFYCG